MTTLTTGWEPSTATADTLVRQYLFGWADVCEAFAVAAGGRTTRRDTFATTDYRRASGYFSSSPAQQLGFVPALRLTLWSLPRPTERIHS